MKRCRDDISSLREMVLEVAGFTSKTSWSDSFLDRCKRNELTYEEIEVRVNEVNEMLHHHAWMLYQNRRDAFITWMDEVDAGFENCEGLSLHQSQYKENVDNFKVDYSLK